MYTFASMSNSIEEAIKIEFGEIDTYPLDKMISRFVDVSKQFYYVFPKTSEKIVSEAIQYGENLLCDNYSIELQKMFFESDEYNLLKEFSNKWENKSDLLKQIKTKCDLVVFYPHTHEKIPDSLKSKILNIVENEIEHKQLAPSENERIYLSNKIQKKIKELVLLYFKRNIDILLTRIPIQHDGKRGGSHWSLILHIRWLKIILADIRAQSNAARNLESFLIMAINRHGLDLFDFFSLENKEKMKLIESAEKQRNEDMLRKDESGKRDKIVWLKPVSNLKKIIRILYEAGYLSEDKEEEILPHFFLNLDSEENVKCPANHKIIIYGKLKNIMYIFNELVRKEFIQTVLLKETSEYDYHAAYILFQHFSWKGPAAFKLNSLRSTLTQLNNDEVKPDNMVYSKVMSKINKKFM